LCHFFLPERVISAGDFAAAVSARQEAMTTWARSSHRLLQFHSAGAFGLDTPPMLLAIADEVIE
jgi:hypothetical protein